MIGGQVVAFPDLVTRAYKTGHELAMHTWSHSYLTTETNEQVVAELMWTATAIKEVTGVTPRFYRPVSSLILSRLYLTFFFLPSIALW
jgi:peptidoglycan/xylan/chitin deacetylase (PgdA/CDA1 family)